MSIFTKVAMKRPPSNTFSLSHDKKLSAKIGRLIPVACIDLVPGDKVTMSSAFMCRFAPMIAPTMHRFDGYIHWFFVPNRIMWPEWEDFITGGRDGTLSPAPPTVQIPSIPDGSNGDYLGLPSFEEGTLPLEVSAFPSNALERIFEEYYKDNTLSTFEAPDLESGPSNATRYNNEPFFRAWGKDYFTSALPWTQRGAEATIPLGGVETFDVSPDSEGSDYPQGSELRVNPADKPGQIYVAGTTPRTDLIGQVEATSINDLRRAFRLQEFLEKNARGGARLTEVILSHFGVKSSDARLQRPEFIGGVRKPIQISEVLQTSSTNDSQGPVDTPQGNMAGHGIGVGNSSKMAYYAEEHGYLMAIFSVLPRSAYQQGVPKHFLRQDKYDYYWPSFANIGEQAIQNKELYFVPDGDPANNDVFGYTPRYAEYKWQPSTVHGEFRSSLDFWHAGRKFSSRPTLSTGFTSCDSTEIDRIFAVQDQDHLWVQVAHDIKARRPMPYFGMPTI